MAKTLDLTPPASIKWWRDARFGMFIHWGIYSVPAGTWKGKRIPSIGEWIMYNAKMSIPEYAALAGVFNPVKFDADEWVSIAKRAGMKYLVITSKHHDGFAMFHSPSNPYNIVDATPYGKDLMKALAKACRKHGLKLCFYYSQAQDWHAPGGAGHWDEVDGGWWKPLVKPEPFAKYLKDKVKPQVKELLTQYGPVGLIWFDTPVAITREQSLDLRRFVHKLQPNCLVSGRVGHDVGDYGSLGDNQIPSGPVKGDWETPATLNDTWGYKSYDHNWKSVQTLLDLLVDLASKGVNYLLNVGPTSAGIIPKPSVSRLLKIGEWMDINGEAIHGSSASPFPYEFDWGRMTAKGKRLYLLLPKWRSTLKINGLRNKVKKATLLADPRRRVKVCQTHDAATDFHTLTLNLGGKRAGKYISVVALDLDGPAKVETLPLQQPSGTVVLPVYMAGLHSAGGAPALAINRAGLLDNLKGPQSSVTWDFKLAQPGEYEAKVVIGCPHHGGKAGDGQRVVLTLGDHKLRGVLKADEKVEGARTQYFPEFAASLGRIRLDQSGTLHAELKAEEAPNGLALASVHLAPAKRG
ncbi:MAG: hypothetical protein A3K19_15635 [Lentisphaerae bacterium RIFOXYB12_FULL_65_16]|nr:MAG: hypothetical protein A3K18_11650 [Lentisphaerae bacterium RIFOXYA12_64_32]OGV88532.1 MAG: hypothetical protein A3K19_15635 [Lentisphaerae bacterium RIFOXYB12_FULL_65_16]